MSTPLTYDILLPTGKQISGVSPAALKKAISDGKLPPGTKTRSTTKPDWVLLKEPAKALAEISPPPPPPAVAPVRMMYPLPPWAPPDIQVFAATGDRFAIEKNGVEVCTVASWDAALAMVNQFAPAPEVVQPTYSPQAAFEYQQPQTFQQTHVVIHQAPSRSGSAIGVLVEIFLVPLTGYLLGGLGVAIAGKGVSSLIGGMILWFVSLLVILFTAGFGVFIVAPIIFLKWIIDIIYCVN